MSSVTSKLRDSCNACAMSKIKCPKERPACSRCESRGVTCHYSFTKRPGRKPENGRSLSSTETITVSTPGFRNINIDNGNGQHGDDFAGGGGHGDSQPPSLLSHHPSLEALFWSESPTPSSGMTPSNTPGIHSTSINSYFGIQSPARPSGVSSPRPDDADVHADCSDVFSMLGDINPFPEFDGFDPKLEKFLESAIESSFAMPMDESSDDTNTTQTQNDIASLLIPVSSITANKGSSEGPVSADTGRNGSLSSSSLSPLASALSSSILSWSAPTFSTSSTVSSLSTSSSSSSSRLLSFPGVADSSSAGHLAQTLDILKTLSSAQSSRYTPFAGSDTSPDGDSFTKLVLGENQQSIDAVGHILSSSSCDEDSFLLAVLSMIVLKILERYDAAAQVKPNNMEHDWGSRFTNGMSSHSADQSHHRSRSLSGTHNSNPRPEDNDRETVAAKLVLGELHRVQRLVNELSREFQKHREAGGDQVMRDGKKLTRLLVTTSTLTQLETDMRKSLNALSTEIIDRLWQR